MPSRRPEGGGRASARPSVREVLRGVEPASRGKAALAAVLAGLLDSPEYAAFRKDYLTARLVRIALPEPRGRNDEMELNVVREGLERLEGAMWKRMVDHVAEVGRAALDEARAVGDEAAARRGIN